RTPGGRGYSATVRCTWTCLSRSDARCSRHRGYRTVHIVYSDTRSEYNSPGLASSVSCWSSSGREWTKRYRADASFSTLLFSRTTEGPRLAETSRDVDPERFNLREATDKSAYVC